MSMGELMDDNVLLGADDDELDYDLEKDEEDALLADPDSENYDQHYETHQDDNQILEEDNFEEQEGTEEDILDIDSNVRLDETEEEKHEEFRSPLLEDEDERIQRQKERNRFSNERNQNQTIHRLTSTDIPDTLDKVAVKPILNSNQNQNNFQRNNGRFQRGRGRGRGRHNFNSNNNNNRGSVFGRVGNITVPTENKTVLINPHFRGNVQANENARLVWDANLSQQQQQQARYSSPQMVHVAPFQAQQPSPWINPPFTGNGPNFDQQQPQQQMPPMQQNFPEQQFNQPGNEIHIGIRPLMQLSNQPFIPQNVGHPPGPPMTNWCEETTYNCEYQTQGNFRGREVRFNSGNNQPPLMLNQHQNMNQPGRNFNHQQQQRPPHIMNQSNVSPLIQLPPQNFPLNQQYDQQSQPFANQQQYPPQNQQFQQHSNQNYQQQNFNQPIYDSYDNQNQFPQNYQNFQQPIPVSNQNYQSNNYEPNFNSNNQEQYHPQHFNNNNRQFNQNRNNQQRSNRNFNQLNRTPPKRRPFENKNNQSSGDRDLPKKKRRSLEFSNLHEVPTVDMPDTTTEDRVEEEDEETKAYRKKIEEQKKLREKILREKEERRKLAAAQKAQEESSSDLSMETESALPIIKTTNIIKKPIMKPAINQQQRNLQQIQISQQKQPQQRLQQQRIVKQPNQQIIRNPGQNINQNSKAIQRRLNNQQPTNILITQKNDQLQHSQQQPQRIVMLKQVNTQNSNNSNRRVVLKGINNKEIITTTSSDDLTQSSDSNLSSFLTNRKVISNTMGDKSVDLNQGLIQTPVVVVSNLAAGTTDVKIRKLCQGLGPIQNIEMIPNARQATIRFKNVVSAHKFFKKYQRKIIDLSMIQVSLQAI